MISIAWELEVFAVLYGKTSNQEVQYFDKWALKRSRTSLNTYDFEKKNF